MTKAACRIDDRLADPLFEVFDGGDFILSSYRDVEWDSTEVAIYFQEKERTQEALECLSRALRIVGSDAVPQACEIRDEDWKLSYRRHFKTEKIGEKLLIAPAWEARPDAEDAGGRKTVILDPGMAFGTGKHETTRACLEYVDSLSAAGGSVLDMGCGSGILSIAAAKLGFSPVNAFDIDPDAVAAAIENARTNAVALDCRVFALGGGSVTLDASIEAAKGVYPDFGLQTQGAKTPSPFGPADLVLANILGPLLIAFADEICAYVRRHLVISGILAENLPETLAAFTSRGLEKVSEKIYGEWASALLRRRA